MGKLAYIKQAQEGRKGVIDNNNSHLSSYVSCLANSNLTKKKIIIIIINYRDNAQVVS